MPLSMRNLFYGVLSLLSLASSTVRSDSCKALPTHSSPIKLLIVTGGHPYEPSEFFALFNAMPSIRYQHVLFDQGKPIAVPVGGLGQYDVVLFYDLQHDALTPEWRDLLDRGRGLVFLHHAIGSFPLSPEIKSIIGGHANFFYGEYPNLPHSNVAYKDQQQFTITDPIHPITCRMKDFQMSDEIYDDMEMDPNVHVLITSDGPQHDKAVAWTWKFDSKRVLYVQMGHGSLGLPMDHGPTAYQNASFKRLLTRGISWAAGRL